MLKIYFASVIIFMIIIDCTTEIFREQIKKKLVKKMVRKQIYSRD